MASPEAQRRAALRRLAAAVLLRAVEDASAGDRYAGKWLLDVGLDLAEELGISADRVRAWLKRQRRK